MEYNLKNQLSRKNFENFQEGQAIKTDWINWNWVWVWKTKAKSQLPLSTKILRFDMNSE